MNRALDCLFVVLIITMIFIFPIISCISSDTGGGSQIHPKHLRSLPDVCSQIEKEAGLAKTLYMQVSGKGLETKYFCATEDEVIALEMSFNGDEWEIK